jgi:putative transposase
VLPATTLQTCIGHLLRQSLDFANWTVVQAAPAGAAHDLYGLYGAQRRSGTGGTRHVRVGGMGQGSHDRGRLAGLVGSHSVSRVFTRDPTPHLHDRCAREPSRELGKIIKTRGHLPNDEAAKLIWLALRNITAKWDRVAPSCRAAMNQFAILRSDRFLSTT